MESATIPLSQPSGSIAQRPVPPLGGGAASAAGQDGGSQRHQPNTYPVSTFNLAKSTNIQLYGQSIFSRNSAFIYGSNEKKSNDQCGVIWKTLLCSANNSHLAIAKHICCNDPLCPVCYPKFTHRLADGVCERVSGYSEIYPDDPFCHLIISPPEGTRYDNMKAAFAALTKIFKGYGGKAGAFWLHWYRINPNVKERLWAAREQWKIDHPYKRAPGFWKLAHDNILKLKSLGDYLVYSPHFHGIASGYLVKSGEFCELTGGWVYKKVKRDEGEDLADSSTFRLTPEDMQGVAHYLSTHCAYEFGKHAVRYIGDISYAKLGRCDKRTEHVQDFCSVCHAPIIEYYNNQVTGELGDLCQNEVRKKVITWTYYKRIPKERPKKDSKVKSRRNRVIGSQRDGT
jgi:hypothetical protein